MFLTAAATLLLAFLALGLGRFSIPPGEVLRILLPVGGEAPRATALTTVLSIRVPRILMALLCGAGLAASGAAFQALFANPLATPDTLGVASGASFGAAFAILLGMGSLGVQSTSLLMGLAAVGLVFVVSASRGGRSMLMVILAGMVVSSLFSALVSLVKVVADPQDVLPTITFWLMGRLSGVTHKTLRLAAPLILSGLGVLFLLRFRLNALALPQDEARSLGLNLPRLRLAVILAGAAVTAAVVATCGVIGWVGLLVPHIARLCFGDDNRRVIPASILFGALFMLLVDTVARTASAAEIPVSILTAVIGAPVFILLLRKAGGIR